MFKLVSGLAGNPQVDVSLEEMKEYVHQHIDVLEQHVAESSVADARIDGMTQIVINYTTGQFTERAYVSDKDTSFDGLAVGLNMLGEELAAANLSLHEKDVLLREIHHRVKNNLQLISSLINIQSTGISEELVLSKFRECQNRIQTIALIHQKLYQSNMSAHIDFSNYVADLVGDLVSMYNSDKLDIELAFDLQPNVDLTLDQSIPTGLIINELVINALKHAFKGVEGRPRLMVTLAFHENNVKLIVKDNGVGSKNDLSNERNQSMGLSLVHALVDQLEGNIAVNGTQGLETTIEFRRA